MKPLQRVAITFPLSVISLGSLSAIIASQPPRSILGFFLSYLFPVVVIVFGYSFVAAFSHLFGVKRHSIARFALPILVALFLIACSVWLAVQMGAFIRHVA